MELWKDGKFQADWPADGEPPPVPLDELELPKQPEALDRAGLESGVGGGFYPGIEGSYRVAQSETYKYPSDESLGYENAFRVNTENIQPGDLTANMAVPWQADFLACFRQPLEDESGNPVVPRYQYVEWWPSQRPISVYPEGSGEPRKWVPYNWQCDCEADHYQDMVNSWYKFGFIVKENDGYVEKERDQDFGYDDEECDKGTPC
jgi:hypothetical protein